MKGILRIATDLGFDEIDALTGTASENVVVLGNTEQAGPNQGLVWRQVTPARLENIAKACSILRPFREIRVSDNTELANRLFSDKKVSSRLNSWLVRTTDPARIEGDIQGLSLDNVDKIIVTSTEASSFLRRRLHSQVTIEQIEPIQAPLDGATVSPISKLKWIGSADPNDGLQDFLRIVALDDLPAELVWTRVPSASEFGSVVSAIAMLGLESRIEFSVPGTFERFKGRIRQSRTDGDAWLCTARDYPVRSAYELLVANGAYVVAFDSLYAQNLCSATQSNVRLTNEGDVIEAAKALKDIRRGSVL